MLDKTNDTTKILTPKSTGRLMKIKSDKTSFNLQNNNDFSNANHLYVSIVYYTLSNHSIYKYYLILGK